jgi:hypothetical protein
MSNAPFRATFTLSDTIEHIGRRLFAHEWTGFEYRHDAQLSRAELTAKRSPLEARKKSFEDELVTLQTELNRSVKAKEIEDIKRRILDAQSRHGKLNDELNHAIPVPNDKQLVAFKAHERRKHAEGTLLNAIREGKLIVHDGHGRELNPSVWTNPHCRHSIELSIVINSKASSEPRRQAARIDQGLVKDWLQTLDPIVKILGMEPADDRLRNYLKQRVGAARGSCHETKAFYRKEASHSISGMSKRLFERIWAEVVPKEWQQPGAPKKNNHPDEIAKWDETVKKSEARAALSSRTIVPGPKK